MKKIVSKRVERMSPSGIREFFELVLGMKDIISLGVGEPDFVTPWSICETAIYGIEKGYTSYTSNKGLQELRDVISRWLLEKYRVRYDPESEILITTGVSEGYDLAIRAIVEPGDEVIIPEPCYVSYAPLVGLVGGKVRYVSTRRSGFKLIPEQLRKAITKETKAIVLNYPSNPTGVSYTKKELNELKEVLLSRGIFVISDEIYGELTYDYSHTPWTSLKDTKRRCIYLNGFSKAYAMTGWRVGFACGPKEVIDAMTKIHQYTMLCAPIMGQIAGVEAIRNGYSSVLEMKEEYNRRRRYLVKGLNRIGLECNMPAGAFYVFPSIKSTGLSSMDFAKRLLKEQKVAVVPGTAFGPSGEGYVRMSYASSMENIIEAVKRIERFVYSL